MNRNHEDMIDHACYAHNLSSCKIKTWKKIQAERDSRSGLIFIWGFNFTTAYM